MLIGLRFLQGAAGAAAAVFAPGFIRAGFRPEAAVRLLGLLGSIESLVPALAPVAGLWLLALPKLQAGSSSAETVSSIQPPPSTRSPS